MFTGKKETFLYGSDVAEFTITTTPDISQVKGSTEGEPNIYSKGVEFARATKPITVNVKMTKIPVSGIKKVRIYGISTSNFTGPTFSLKNEAYNDFAMHKSGDEIISKNNMKIIDDKAVLKPLANGEYSVTLSSQDAYENAGRSKIIVFVTTNEGRTYASDQSNF